MPRQRPASSCTNITGCCDEIYELVSEALSKSAQPLVGLMCYYRGTATQRMSPGTSNSGSNRRTISGSISFASIFGKRSQEQSRNARQVQCRMSETLHQEGNAWLPFRMFGLVP